MRHVKLCFILYFSVTNTCYWYCRTLQTSWCFVACKWLQKSANILIEGGQNKMAAILQMTCSIAFSLKKLSTLWFELHWNLLLWVQWTISGLAPNRRWAIIWTNVGRIYWSICASLGLDDLTRAPCGWYLLLYISTVKINASLIKLSRPDFQSLQ